MNDTITVCGIIATEPRHLVTDTGIAITSMRLASPSRRWDRSTSTWTNGTTNWYTVTAFRSLAGNVHRSVKKGDRIVVTGRVRIRTWERDGRGGTSVEIDAEGVGHDLAWGISNWVRVPRHVNESSAAPGDGPNVNPTTGEVTAPEAHGDPVVTEPEPRDDLPDPHEADRHSADDNGADFDPLSFGAGNDDATGDVTGGAAAGIRDAA